MGSLRRTALIISKVSVKETLKIQTFDFFSLHLSQALHTRLRAFASESIECLEGDDTLLSATMFWVVRSESDQVATFYRSGDLLKRLIDLLSDEKKPSR